MSPESILVGFVLGLLVLVLLVARGAELNAQDTFYRFRSVDVALMNGHRNVATFLLERGSEGADNALRAAVAANDLSLARTALARRSRLGCQAKRQALGRPAGAGPQRSRRDDDRGGRCVSLEGALGDCGSLMRVSRERARAH